MVRITWKRPLPGKAKKTEKKSDPNLGPEKPRPRREALAFRRCLGWCNKKIRTTKAVRFCPRCSERSASAGAGFWLDAQACEVRV